MNEEVIYLNKVNEVYFQLEMTRGQAMELKEMLSFYAPNYKYHPQFKAGFWNGKIPFFNIKENLLPIGLLPYFIDYCEQFKYPFVFNFDRTEEFGSDITEDRFNSFVDAIFPPDGNIYPRYYQQEAIYKVLTNKRGVLQLATSSGKSLIQYSIIRYLLAMNENILLVVPSISLVEQMFSDFESYGWTEAKEHCNLIYAGKSFDPNKKVTISTWQSIYNKSPEFFKKFTGLVIDEVHLAAGKSISTICSNCKNAAFRVGLTGTMPKDDASIATIVGYLGPVLYKLGAKELIDLGVISQIEIKNIIAKYPEKMCIQRMDYATEQKDIFEYANRTKKIMAKLVPIIRGQNTLLLVQRIEHLKEVRDHIVDNYQDFKVYTISGETKPEERERIRKIIDTEDNVILVATYQTLSTGVSIKKLHHIIFFASYKSEVKVLQSIGRGLRMHTSKDKMILWDVVDDMRYRNNGKAIKNYSYNHWEKYRLAYYEEQQFEYTNETINI
jgi:superfamily II DNA or RNA helicase